jgi:hypothetical protein
MSDAMLLAKSMRTTPSMSGTKHGIPAHAARHELARALEQASAPPFLLDHPV